MIELLKEKQIKMTKQRRLVMDKVIELGSKATAKNIYLECNDEVDKSTVYRIIDLFVAKDIFVKNLSFNNEIFYSLKEEHGHYFICIKCHKKEKLKNCPLLKIDDDLEKNKGYKVLSHIVQIEGICNKCQKTHKKKQINC